MGPVHGHAAPCGTRIAAAKLHEHPAVQAGRVRWLGMLSMAMHMHHAAVGEKTPEQARTPRRAARTPALMAIAGAEPAGAPHLLRAGIWPGAWCMYVCATALRHLFVVGTAVSARQIRDSRHVLRILQALCGPGTALVHNEYIQ